MQIDELITELSFALERLENNPTYENYDLVWEETSRIRQVAEELVIEYVDPDDYAV
jgi:hypothetical protein